MIRHILLIRFKDASLLSEIEKLKDLFESMPEKVEGVVSVEWGTNDSPRRQEQRLYALSVNDVCG